MKYNGYIECKPGVYIWAATKKPSENAMKGRKIERPLVQKF